MVFGLVSCETRFVGTHQLVTWAELPSTIENKTIYAHKQFHIQTVNVEPL